MKKKFKVCLVGCGVISDNHLAPLSELDNVEIVGICDIDLSRAEEKRDIYSKNARVYEGYAQMLEIEHPDAVHILTPHHLHTEMTLTALSRGINVFLEKPLCIKREDIEKIIEAEAESDAGVCVCFQNRFNAVTEKIREIAEADGGICRAFATVIWNRPDSYYKKDLWRGKWETEGGGALINQAIHTLDLLYVILGKPEKVQADVSKLRHGEEIEVEDTAELLIDFDGGKRAVVFVSTCFDGKDSTTLHLETKNHLIEVLNDRLYLDGERVPLIQNNEYIGKACYGTAHGDLIRKFYRALEAGEQMPITVSSASWAPKMIFAAYNSSNEIALI